MYNGRVAVVTAAAAGVVVLVVVVVVVVFVVFVAAAVVDFAQTRSSDFGMIRGAGIVKTRLHFTRHVQ